MVFSNNLLMGAAGQATGYEIEQSIRFDNVNGVNAGGAQMFRLALTGTPTNTKKATISAWVKRSTLGYNQVIAYSGDPNGSTAESLRFNTNDTITFNQASSVYTLTTNQVFKDVSAWYHIVAEIDTANGTAADRANLYVNGTKVTSFSTENYPTQDYVTNWTASSSSIAHTWGTNGIPSAGPSSQLFAGYMADMYVLDGEKAGASSFGETNDDGVWIPTAYSGSFGNNGYYMTGGNASALGEDFSGNNLDFTTVALATTDQMLDTPTLNASTLNPLWAGAGLSDGNLVATATGNSYQRAISTFAIDDGGKYACEFQKSSGTFGLIGIMQLGNNTVTSGNSNMYGYNVGTGEVFKGNPTASVLIDLGAGAANSLMRVEYDSSADTIKIFDDGVEIFPAATGVSNTVGLTGQNSLHFGCAPYGSGTVITATFQGLSGTPTTGFKELASANLPTPSITDGSAHFQPFIYASTGTSTTFVQEGNSQFEPGLVWVKSRTGANNHLWFDQVRGVTKFIRSDTNNTENTVADTLTAFNSNGFTAGADSVNWGINYPSRNNVAWQWKANGAGSSNEDGATTSTVSANTTSGFSIVKWTGTGANTTLGHGLGAAPQMILIKNLADADSWVVYHEDVGATKGLTLDTTAAATTASTFFNNTAPTSSVFSVGSGGRSNGSSDGMIAYCFAEIPGYSSFGSYTGNGSTDGPFVYTGFTPRYILFKRTNATESWPILDTARGSGNFGADAGTGGDNPTAANDLNAVLVASTAAAEEDNSAGSRKASFNSNGFKVRTTNTAMNGSGSTYIYMAFAEHPFGGDGAAPATAR